MNDENADAPPSAGFSSRVTQSLTSMSEYAVELLEGLSGALSAVGRNGRFTNPKRRVVLWIVQCHSVSPIDLHVSAESLPLAANEAVTLTLNLHDLASQAIQRDLAARGSGDLRVSFTVDPHAARPVVADNGPGLPPGSDLDVDAGVDPQVVRAGGAPLWRLVDAAVRARRAGGSHTEHGRGGPQHGRSAGIDLRG